VPLSRTLPDQYVVKFKINKLQNYCIVLSNEVGEKLVLGYDQACNRYYIDRTKSGKVDFNPELAKVFFATRVSKSSFSDIKLIVDASSIELFADNGFSVMTCLFFPQKPFDHLQFQNSKNLTIRNLE
jgi:fructan beta-fructosidase